MDTTGVDGPWLQLVYLKIWLQIFPGHFFPIFLEFFQVLSQFLYEHLPVPTGWTNISASKFANWPEVEELVFLPTLVLQPTTSRVKFFEDPHVPTCLPVLLLKMSASTGFTRPACLRYRMMFQICFDEMKLPNFTQNISHNLKESWK